MGPDWTRALRFPPGSRLRFTRTLNAPLRRAIEQESPDARAWLAAVEGAVVTLESVDATRCAVRVDAPSGNASIECVPAGPTTYDVHARLQRGSDLHAQSLGDVGIMLGGVTDVYLAERGARGTRHLLRLRYESDGRVEIGVFTAPFAERLSSTMRALLPTLVIVGRLDLTSGEAVA